MTARLQTWWNQPSGGWEVLRIALPMIVSTLSWALMMFIDRVFLFWDSQAAVAASLPAAMVFFAVVCLPLGICGYTNAFVSQYFGAGRPERIGPAVWQGVWVALVAAPLMLAIVPLAPKIFAVADHAADVQELEVEYFVILLYGAGFLLAGEALQGFFTGRGLTLTVMIVTALAAGVNIVLDYLWIFGYGGFPAMHIAGAAWATNVAYAFKAVAFLVLMLRRDTREHYATTRCRWDGELASRLLRFGTPSGLQLVCEVLGFTVFMLYLGRLGETELAATNLAFNISSFAFMPVFGLGIATVTLVGQRLGEDRDDLAARATWSACALAVVYMAILSTFYVVVPDVILSFYFYGREGPNQAELHAMAVVLLRYVAAYNLLDALGIVLVSALKGAGDARFVMWVTLVMAGLLTFASWLAVGPLQAGLHGCWWLVVAWVWIVGVVYFIRFRQGRWRQMRVIEPAVDAA
jgi:MATE family multidrug resistance protein